LHQIFSQCFLFNSLNSLPLPSFSNCSITIVATEESSIGTAEEQKLPQLHEERMKRQDIHVLAAEDLMVLAKVLGVIRHGLERLVW
jgi:hypothetical protein